MANLKYYTKNINIIIRGNLALLGLRMKPDFFIVGAQKAGTTALFEMLSKHPQIIKPKRKEIHYFDKDTVYKKNNHKYYHSFFPLKQKGKITFDATPFYLYSSTAATRIYNYNPLSKIIIILRNPTERALSAWNFYKQKHPDVLKKYYGEIPKLDNLVQYDIDNIKHQDSNNNPIGIVKRGVYIDQVNEYYSNFSKEQILVLKYEDMVNDVNSTINELQNFLKIEHYILTSIRANVVKYDKNTDYSKVRMILNDFYRPFNKELSGLLERDFNW
jgi:hypothetical protein